MMSSSLPYIWKNSIVTPIPKKSSLNQIDNFRPISILCATSKIIEKIIHQKLSHHLETNGIIPDCQHGFRDSHSVTSQLLSVVDDFSLAIENKNCVDVIYYDFRKAFDKIPHSRLLTKLETYGIKGPLLSWIKNYLYNRKFCVKVGTSLSPLEDVTSGVPQGSILGPLLFITYIADLPKFCETPNVNIKLFADDLKSYYIYTPTNQCHAPLQCFIDKLTQYSDVNGLEIAIDKCNVLYIGNKNPNNVYTLNNIPITNVPKGDPIRDLGIHFTSDLKWRPHIDIVVKKSRKISYALLRSLKSKNPQFLNSMFQIYVIPILEFGCPIFNPYYAKDINYIEKVQKNFLQMIHRRSREYIQNPNKIFSYSELLSKYNLETLEIRRLKICLKLFHQFFLGYIPTSHNNSFSVLPSKTRGDSHKIIASACIKEVRFNSFFVKMSRIYSKLPPTTRNSSITEFSRSLDTCDLSPYIICKIN